MTKSKVQQNKDNNCIKKGCVSAEGYAGVCAQFANDVTLTRLLEPPGLYPPA